MRTAIVLAVGLFAAGGAWAKDKPGGTWVSESVSELFRCVIPEDWDAESRPGPDRAVRYSDGTASITVTRYGLKGSKHATPKLYLDRLRLAAKLRKAGKVKVSGRESALWRRRYEIYPGGEEAPGAPPEWVYEEIVILEEQGSFWALHFASPSIVYQDKPQGLGVWKRFLKGFRLG